MSEAVGGGRHTRATEVLLRSLGQVIFLNHPLTGLLLLLALLLQSAALAAFAVVGVVTAKVTALTLGFDRGPLRDGIYGLNGALVGSVIGAFADPGAAALTRLLLAISGATFSSLLVHRLGHRSDRRTAGRGRPRGGGAGAVE